MSKLRQLMYKLQTALCQQGRYIKVNQHQAYSPKQGRMVTKYVLQETRDNGAGKTKTVTLLETYQQAEVVEELARIYGGGDGE